MKRLYLLPIILMLAPMEVVLAQSSSEAVKQPREVVEAYEVVRRFQTMMAEDLDFDRAFEATFVKNAKRRREIAITEGEFDRNLVRRVDHTSLISAFKSRTQFFFLMLPLLGMADTEKATVLRPKFKEFLDRKPSQSPAEFRAFAAQLKRDVDSFREHVDHLSREDPSIAERIRKFKEELSKEIEPPDRVVEPLTAYSRGRVLKPHESYYRIGDYSVIREDNEMRIIGIRFFGRLF